MRLQRRRADPARRRPGCRHEHGRRHQEGTNQQKGQLMTINKETTGRTEHLLALMTRGDDLFSGCDWQALDDVHHRT